MNSLGKLGERYAANYLIKHKYKLVESNFQSRFGEIDIIVKNKSYLVFVEVKQRDVNSIATPAEFVDKPKQNKIIATANYTWQIIPRIYSHDLMLLKFIPQIIK